MHLSRTKILFRADTPDMANRMILGLPTDRQGNGALVLWTQYIRTVTGDLNGICLTPCRSLIAYIW